MNDTTIFPVSDSLQEAEELILNQVKTQKEFDFNKWVSLIETLKNTHLKHIQIQGVNNNDYAN